MWRALLVVWALAATDGGTTRPAPRVANPAPRAAVTLPAVPLGPIAGWTIDPTGAPIGGVHVHVAGTEVTVDSDAAGAFHVAMPSGDHKLQFDGPDVFPAELAWHQRDGARQIVLARRGHLVVHATAGAEVALSDGSGTAIAHADAQGVARFDDVYPGPHEVWAVRGAAVSPLVRVEDGADVTLVLEPAATVHGHLATDAALAGATVELVPLDVDHAVRGAAVAADGTFAIEGVPRGRWRVEPHAPGYVATGESVVSVNADAVDATVPLVKAGTVSGSVADTAGTPVANVRLVLREQGAPAVGREADDGRAFTLGRARWVHPLAGERIRPIRDAARFGAPRPGVRGAECGQGHCGIDIGHVRGSTIHAAADGELVIVAPDIRGETGRFVAIDHGGGLRTMYMHMDQVRAGLEVGQRVHAGDPLGTLGSTGFALDNPHLHFAVTQERDNRIWYLDPEPMLERAVVLTTPRVVEPAVPDKRLIAKPREAAAIAAPHVFVSDAHGQFHIDGVAPGTYVAVAFVPGLAPGSSAAFVVRSGAETSGVSITLKPGALVRGRVVGPNGAIDGALVTAATGFGETSNKIAMTFTDHAGEYVLRALPEKVTLDAGAPGYGEQQRIITIADASASHREDFVLIIENAQLRGQVVASDGGAPGAVTVRIVDGPSLRTIASEPTGRFTIDHVAAGAYTIEIASADAPVLRAHLRTGEFKDLRLERGGGVRMQLRDARSGAPLSNVRVEASGPNAATAARASDATGTVELRGLVLGTWSLVVRGKGFTPARRTVTIAAGSPQTVSLDVARGARIAGVVRDRFGRRVAGAKVTFGESTATADADGNFHIDDAPAGPGWLEAEDNGARGALQVDLAPGDERANLTIDLK